MAYLDNRRRLSLGSVAAVVAIHGAAGVALVLGLTVSGVIDDREILIGFEVDKPEPPPPPPAPEPEPSAKRPEAPSRPIPIPAPPFPFPSPTAGPETTLDDLPPLPPVPPGPGEGTSKVEPLPTPSFAPVGAAPRNDPQRWVTTDDYRGNWIRQEMTGRARFRLDIAADGRVTRCTITGSSGHPELDAATCTLVSKRARFQPARGGGGEPVAGSYANTIDWQLPR